MADGVRGGFWLDESVEFARMLEADGSLDALTLTGGSSFENPMYLFRGEAPIAEMAEMFPGVLKTGHQARSAASSSRSTRSRRRTSCPTRASSATRSSMPLVLLGGINRLDTITHALDDGFAFVQIGRALLREPELLARDAEGPAARSRSASTATSACPRSTRARAACSCDLSDSTSCAQTPSRRRSRGTPRGSGAG